MMDDKMRAAFELWYDNDDGSNVPLDIVEWTLEYLRTQQEPNLWKVIAKNGMTRSIVECKPNMDAFDLGETLQPYYTNPVPPSVPDDGGLLHDRCHIDPAGSRPGVAKRVPAINQLIPPSVPEGWECVPTELGTELYDAYAHSPITAAPNGWRPIETAPVGQSIMLAVAGTSVPIYCGMLRHGSYGEPQSHELAWRCDSSGRFSNPTHWRPLPDVPKPEKE